MADESHPLRHQEEGTRSDAESVQCVPYRRQVSTAEIVGVNQQRVEVVQVAARLEEGIVYAPDLRVALQKVVAERVEEAYEGHFDLRVGVVEGGIQEGGYALSSRQHVGAPDVAVDKRRRVGDLDELVEPFRQPLHT